MSDTKKELTTVAAFELVIIVIAVIAALMEAWGLFAALAFTSLLVPLWVIAVSTMVSAFGDNNDQ